MAKTSMKKRNNKRTGKFFLPVLVLLLGVSAISGAAFAKEMAAYKTAEAEYEAINENIVAIADAEPAASEEEVATEAVSDDTADIVAVEEAAPVATEVEEEEAVEITYPEMDIDFGALLEVNSDLIGIIYIPALDLSYPVVQGGDNEKYLHETFDGTKNAAGSIFIDSRAASDFSDANTFVYGHNMKNMTMFGSLKRFLYEDGLCSSDPYIYLYMVDGSVRKYHVFSYAVVSVSDDLYYSFDGDEAYDEYVDAALERNSYKGDQTDDFTKRPNLITLSTCYGTEHAQNFVVQAALEGVAQ